MANKRQNNNINYTFLLKCMAGLGAAAILIAGITAVAIKSATLTATAMLATFSAFAFTPFVPIILVMAVALFLTLPGLWCCSNLFTPRFNRNRFWPSQGGFSSSPQVLPAGPQLHHGHP